MAVVSISLPDALLDSADRLIEDRGFGGRSEFVRACVRDFLTQNAQPEPGGLRTATVTLIYPEGAEKQFSKLRHTFSDVIRTMLHGHAEGYCMEVFVVEGPSERIRAFGDALRGTREALQVSLVHADAWRSRSPAPDPAHSHGSGGHAHGGRPPPRR